MRSFFRFMANNGGRLLRIVAGSGLIALGVLNEPDTNWLLIIIGMVPLAAGVFDFCLLAPIFGLPFNGKRLRKVVHN